MRLVVGVTGASGSIYADRLLSFLAHARGEMELDVAVVFSKTGRLVWNHELGTDPAAYGFPIHAPGDFTAPFASGSARYDAMVVAPCSAGCMARIAHGLSVDLVGRAADVMLKERRPLVLVLRESPFSLIHIENMAAVTRAGGLVMPAAPHFYARPQTVVDVVDTVTARVLDHLGLDNELVRRWAGLHG
jgi:4-hydroxy-3-polyprenylbenzoate decarboxylase